MSTLIANKSLETLTARIESATMQDAPVFVAAAHAIKAGGDTLKTLSTSFSRGLLRVISKQPAGEASKFLSSVKREAKHGSIPRILAAVNKIAAHELGGRDFALGSYVTVKEIEEAAEAMGAIDGLDVTEVASDVITLGADGSDVLADASAEHAEELALLRAVVAEARRIIGSDTSASLADVLAELRTYVAA